MPITIDVSVGDIIINGRKVVNFRIPKVQEKITRDKDDYAKYQKPDDSDFDQPQKTKNESQYKKMMEIIG